MAYTLGTVDANGIASLLSALSSRTYRFRCYDDDAQEVDTFKDISGTWDREGSSNEIARMNLNSNPQFQNDSGFTKQIAFLEIVDIGIGGVIAGIELKDGFGSPDPEELLDGNTITFTQIDLVFKTEEIESSSP